MPLRCVTRFKRPSHPEHVARPGHASNGEQDRSYLSFGPPFGADRNCHRHRHEEAASPTAVTGAPSQAGARPGGSPKATSNNPMGSTSRPPTEATSVPKATVHSGRRSLTLSGRKRLVRNARTMVSPTRASADPSRESTAGTPSPKRRDVHRTAASRTRFIIRTIGRGPSRRLSYVAATHVPPARKPTPDTAASKRTVRRVSTPKPVVDAAVVRSPTGGVHPKPLEVASCSTERKWPHSGRSSRGECGR